MIFSFFKEVSIKENNAGRASVRQDWFVSELEENLSEFQQIHKKPESFYNWETCAFSTEEVWGH